MNQFKVDKGGVLKLGKTRVYTTGLDGEQYILEGEVEAIAGGTPEENAAITRRVLDGEKGAYRNAAVLNAAAAIVAGGKAATIAEGVKLAETAVDSGAALKKLELLVMRGK